MADQRSPPRGFPTGKPTTATPADLRQGVSVGHPGDQLAWNASV